MKPLRLFLFVVGLICLGTIPSQADKFSSSLNQDFGSSVTDQTASIIAPLPPQTSETKMPSAASASIQSNSALDPTLSGISSAPTAIPPISSQNPGLGNPIAPSLKSPFEVKKTKISATDYEAKFKKLQEQQAEEKSKKKKKLSESIRDELKNYGLFFLFGLAAILLVYALRKDAPASKPHAAEAPKELKDKPRDIWKEDF